MPHARLDHVGVDGKERHRQNEACFARADEKEFVRQNQREEDKEHAEQRSQQANAE